MRDEEFGERFGTLLRETLDNGPGPRDVTRIVIVMLADHILNEDGANALETIEEAVAILRRAITDAEAA